MHVSIPVMVFTVFISGISSMFFKENPIIILHCSVILYQDNYCFTAQCWMINSD